MVHDIHVTLGRFEHQDNGGDWSIFFHQKPMYRPDLLKTLWQTTECLPVAPISGSNEKANTLISSFCVQSIPTYTRSIGRSGSQLRISNALDQLICESSVFKMDSLDMAQHY